MLLFIYDDPDLHHRQIDYSHTRKTSSQMASNGCRHCCKTSHRLLRAHVAELLSDTRQQPFIGLELLMIYDKVRPDILIPVNLCCSDTSI